MEFTKSKYFCPMPFMHVHIDSGGFVKNCCVSNVKYGNIKSKSLNEIWNSKEVVALREKFLNNEPDARCQNCYDKESAGGSSLRTETIDKYHSQIEEFIENPKPVYFDIRFSNVCNLKCRTCWHGNSSKWFEDAKTLNRNLGEKSIIKIFQDGASLQEKLGSYFKNAVEFYFAGGEPLLMEEQLFCLEQLIANKNYSCLIRYNTNLGNLHQLDKDLMTKLAYFDKVEVLASIDGLDKKGSQIRSGINLDKFEANFKKLKSLANISIKIAPTFSILSAELLPELHQYFFNQNLISIDDLHFNTLHQPYFYNVKSFPKERKNELVVILQNHINWIKEKNGKTQDWENAIEYMLSEDWSYRYEKAKQETQVLNELRDEDLVL